MIQQSLSRNRYSRVTSRRANILSSACNGSELPARAPSNKRPLDVNPTGDNQPRVGMRLVGDTVRRHSPLRRTANIRCCQGNTTLQSTLSFFCTVLAPTPMLLDNKVFRHPSRYRLATCTRAPAHLGSRENPR